MRERVGGWWSGSENCAAPPECPLSLPLFFSLSPISPARARPTMPPPMMTTSYTSPSPPPPARAAALDDDDDDDDAGRHW